MLFACKVPPSSEPPPPPGGVRITVTGYPESFFNGRTCYYAICESGGDPNTPVDRVATGTISLTGGTGTSKVENLEAGQYNIYVAVDTNSNGYTFSGGYPTDGDLHDAETNITVNDIVIDRSLTLKAVAGEITWPPSSSGELYVAIGSHVPPDDFSIVREVDYSGITSTTPTTYCIDATEQSGSFYLWGVLGFFDLVGWYDDADGFAGPPPDPPVDVDNLKDSYDFDLD